MWAARWPYFEIGLAVSNAFVVVDLDRKRGCDGFKDFRQLEGCDPCDVETPIATTPSGGLHLYYAADGLTFRNSVKKIGPGVDIRADGLYVIAPGYKNGREWLRLPTGPWARAPEWLNGNETTRDAVKDGQVSDFIGIGSDIGSAMGANGRYRGDTPYGAACLAGICCDLRAVEPGARDDTVNAKFYRIGRLIGEGELGNHAIDMVIAAAMEMPEPLSPEVVLEKANRVIRKGILDTGNSLAHRAEGMGAVREAHGQNGNTKSYYNGYTIAGSCSGRLVGSCPGRPLSRGWFR
jgi:hypothetical protein